MDGQVAGHVSPDGNVISGVDYEHEPIENFNETNMSVFIKKSNGSTNASLNGIYAFINKESEFKPGGFEGDKIKNKNSAYNKQRKLGGWKNERLPWNYHIDKKTVYKADLTQ